MTRARKQALIIAAVGLLVAGLLAGVGLSSRARMTRLAGERPQVENIVRALRLRAAQLPLLEEQLKEGEKQEYQFEAFLPDARGEAPTQLKRRLTEFAHRAYQETGADLGALPGEVFLHAFKDSAAAKGAATAGLERNIERYTLAMDLRGSLFQFVRFLNLIETARPLLRVEAFKIVADREKQIAALSGGKVVPHLTIELTVSTFGLKPEAKP